MENTLIGPTRKHEPSVDFWFPNSEPEVQNTKTDFLKWFKKMIFRWFLSFWWIWKWLIFDFESDSRHDRHDCQSPLEAKWVMGPFSKRPTVYFLNKQRVLNKRSDEWLWCLFTIMLEIDKSKRWLIVFIRVETLNNNFLFGC